MKIAALFLTLFPSIILSQAPVQTVTDTNPSDKVTKVVRVRYGNARTLAALAANGAPVNVNADNLLQVIVLHGRANDTATVEQTIHELDVPAATQTSYKSKDVELIVSVVGGSNSTELMPGGPISEVMAPVVKQLRAVFPYKSYQILSSMLLRSSEGAKAESNGVMKSLTNSDQPRPTGYGVAYDEANVSPEEGRPTIHLKNFHFRTTVPTPVGSTNGSQYSQIQMNDVNIRTDIDLREGQKVVAGKANIDNSDLALFVVLTARLVE